MSSLLSPADAPTPAEGEERRDDVDMRRIGVLVLLLGAALSTVLVALVPPTAAGTWGWMAAAVVIALRVGAASGLAAGRGVVSRAVLYTISLTAVGGLCVLQLLASAEAYFHDLVLIDLLFVAAVHTPRRTAVAVALAVAGQLPALLSNDATAVSVAEWAAEAILWSLVAGLVLLYTERSRGHRAELRRNGERAEALARVDALTGLGNRRAFDETLGREIGSARRYGTPVSILIGDLDDFKAVNDRHGHQAGDDVLRAVAGRLADAVRGPDACFRWGGDEFAVVLPRTAHEAAALVATRIGATIVRDVADPAGKPVGITLGVAELSSDQTATDLLAAADAALLEAKTSRGEAERGGRFERGDAHTSAPRR